MQFDGASSPRFSLHHSASVPTGSVLLYAVLALILLGALTAAISHITSAASQTGLTENHQARATYLALSGLNAWTPGRTGTYAVGGGSFTLSQSGPDANGLYAVTSQGTVFAGTAAEANVRVAASRTGVSPITFTDNLADFASPVVGKTTNSSNAVSIYAASTGYSLLAGSPYGHGGLHTVSVTSAYASGSLVFAKATTNTHGAIWYTGSRGVCPGGECGDGLCASGKCTLGKGLRAYFGFVFSTEDTSPDSLAYGDGFTFTVANAATNHPATAAGGPASDSRGEYLGYAGPGPSGQGIAAPKLAVEVDVYPNMGRADPDQVDSRADHATANHIALVWWGGAGLYDDNVHGAGANPVYAATASQVGYYERRRQYGYNWLEDGEEHALRVEIHRADVSGGGTYRVRVWIDATAAGVDDVTRDYTAQSPQLDYTTTLTAADHAGLDTILFGWTEGTGAAAQTVAIHDFALEFRH